MPLPCPQAALRALLDDPAVDGCATDQLHRLKFLSLKNLAELLARSGAAAAPEALAVYCQATQASAGAQGEEGVEAPGGWCLRAASVPKCRQLPEQLEAAVALQRLVCGLAWAGLMLTWCQPLPLLQVVDDDAVLWSKLGTRVRGLPVGLLGVLKACGAH